MRRLQKNPDQHICIPFKPLFYRTGIPLLFRSHLAWSCSFSRSLDHRTWSACRTNTALGLFTFAPAANQKCSPIVLVAAFSMQPATLLPNAACRLQVAGCYASSTFRLAVTPLGVEEPRTARLKLCRGHVYITIPMDAIASYYTFVLAIVCI